MACIFSLVGFESATALGGEAKSPMRNIPKRGDLEPDRHGLFMVFMSYVEVFGTGATPRRSAHRAPLNTLAQSTGSWLPDPDLPRGHGSFFSLSLSCLNAGARIIYPMARHGLPAPAGQGPPTNRTPHVAITVYIVLMFLIPTFLRSSPTR